MKKILGIIILSLLLSGNAHSVRQDGSGELKISYKILQNFITYLRGSYNNKPMVFWVTADGQGSYYWYCPYGVACQSGGASREKQNCEDFYKGKECFRFARKSSVRWKNGINPGKGSMSKFNEKMSDQEITAKLTELGFYGNETSSTVKPKITKKKEEPKKVKKSTDADKGNIVSQIKDLKELLDNGAITQDEFDKAKKKLLN